MAIRRAVLLIAEISGYTRYMHWNRTHLAHAQLTVAALLESVIDAARGLKLAKLEGDAAFFWAPDGDAKVLVHDGLSRMRESFLARREKIRKADVCSCASCAQLDQVPVVEYVLMTDAVAQCLDEPVRRLCTPLTHDFEGIGQTSTHYIDLAASQAVPIVPQLSTSDRLRAKLMVELSTLPFVLGIKQACVGFRHLDRGTIQVPLA